MNPISDTLQLVWQIVSLKSLSLQPFGREEGGGGALSLLFSMNLENPSAQRPRSGHGHAGNPDTADGIAMGTGPLTTISYSREEKRAISPQSVSLPLFAFFEILSHILVLSHLRFLLHDSNLDYMPFHFYKTNIICFIKELGGITVEPCDCRNMSEIFAIDCFDCISYVSGYE